MVPGVADVKLTGPDGLNPWPRGPNVTGGYQLDGRFLTLQDQALGALLKLAVPASGGHCFPGALQLSSVPAEARSQRYIEFYKRVHVLAPLNAAGIQVPPPVATTDGVNFDRQPLPPRCWRTCGSCSHREYGCRGCDWSRQRMLPQDEDALLAARRLRAS